ncbi:MULTISPECIES: DUF397 domain-containing protein [Actinomadura]|uniref:DUF397 domain-containing protein n=1 Tax=Actinomadura yumaensis TaxID=111807 RepID=A0ABW2D0Y4_9ACTN|nr:DUF397 domain-containing protein [Actinomadura sp. J1-007]
MNGSVWRKSRRSNTSGGDCVEVAVLTGYIGIRDSKAPGAGHLALSVASFAGLVAQVKRGEVGLR